MNSLSCRRLFYGLCVLCGLTAHASALDRNAFTFTQYNLAASVDPSQQRLGVRGTISLRNDSSLAQKNLSLQISSSLGWRSIQFERKSVEFLTHTYTSDIDHTGALSEAIVTLPHAIEPGQTIELAIGYEGTIPLDITRLTQIGVPAEAAKHTDWDQIGASFTAVRGIGYVAWYPVSTEAAILSNGDSVEEAVGKWKQRQAESGMSVSFESSGSGTFFFSGVSGISAVNTPKNTTGVADFDMSRVSTDAPTFVMGEYRKFPEIKASSVYYLQNHEAIADSLAKQIQELDLIANLYARGGPGIEVLDNPDPMAAPFTSAQILIMPFKSLPARETKLTLLYALVHAKVYCRRAWMQEGLAHYAQAFYLDQQSGRQAALDYLNAHQSELVKAEKQPADANSLLAGIDDIYFQSKAMRVWWMLHDMLGSNSSIPSIARHYKISEDQSAGYIQKLVESKGHRDLQWFFDDWVYHDRGLPDFRVASVFPSQLPAGGYLVTVTIENLGAAGAEVPVILQIAGGNITLRLQVFGKSKNSIRFEVPTAPQSVTVNDGSVPESDMNNNTYTIAK